MQNGYSLFFALLLILYTSITNCQVKSKVIIDVDMGQFNDDALAMFMLLQSDMVEMLGVTVVSGNTWVEEGTAYTLRQLEIINRTDVPVFSGTGIPLMGDRQPYLDAEEKLWGTVRYTGAWMRKRPQSYLELSTIPYGGYPAAKPQAKNAVDFIVESVKKAPNEITLFVLGPAMNVALAISKNPEIIPLIKQVIYMGGAFEIPGNTTPAAEFNWWFCPESARICLRAPFKKQIIIPLDGSRNVYFKKEYYDRIVSGPNTPLVKMFRDFYAKRFESNPGYRTSVWDVLTAGLFLKPELAVRLEERYVDVDVMRGLNYGRSMSYRGTNRRGSADAATYPAGTQSASILFEIDEAKFFDYFVDLMTRSYK